jgi:hypothetical protein
MNVWLNDAQNEEILKVWLQPYDADDEHVTFL